MLLARRPYDQQILLSFETESLHSQHVVNQRRDAEHPNEMIYQQFSLSHKQLKNDHDAIFVVRSCNVKYLKSANFEDELEISTRVDRKTSVRLNLIQEVKRKAELLVVAEVELAVIDSKGSVKKLPLNLLEKTIKASSDVKNNFSTIEIIHIDGSLWDDLGAGLSKEIELIASSYLEILKTSKENYKKLQEVNITVSSNTNFFASIAKIRSIRVIFNNIFNHFKINGRLNITSRSSSNIIFKEDPWVNQLRITTAALSAAIGGADRIICNNITQKLGQAPEFIKRLTRNTHIILQEES